MCTQSKVPRHIPFFGLPNRPERWTLLLPECTVGKLRTREGQPLVCGRTLGQRWCSSSPKYLPGTETTPSKASSLLPYNGAAGGGAGQQGRQGAGGGTPTGSGIVPGAAIQRNTGCQALPQQLWLLWWQPLQPGPLLRGEGEERRGQRSSPSSWTSGTVTVWPLLTATPPSAPAITPIAGSVLHIPHTCALSIAQMAPPPGSLPTLCVSQMPTLSLHGLSGFPPPKP